MTYQYIDRSDSANQPHPGRHAGSCKRVPWARWGKVTALSVILSFLGAYFLGTVAPAQAATVRPHAASWTDQTCHALESWERDQTADRLSRLVVTAAHLPKSYLKADVFELAADAASPSKNAAQYLSVADQYAGEDCWGGA